MAASRLTRIITSLRLSERQAAEEVHAKSTMKTWKRVSLFVAIPAVSYLTWKNFIATEAHDEHREFTPWPHMRIRNKPFPWGDGDKTLFHNPHQNLGPQPEEEEETEKMGIRAKVSQLWMEYLLEDPEERASQREAHLRAMQKRHFEYLAKRKDLEKYRLQNRHYFKEIENAPVNNIEEIN